MRLPGRTHKHLIAGLCLVASAWLADGEALAARYARGALRLARTCAFRSSDSYALDHHGFEPAPSRVVVPGSGQLASPDAPASTAAVVTARVVLAPPAGVGRVHLAASPSPAAVPIPPAPARGPPALLA